MYHKPAYNYGCSIVRYILNDNKEHENPTCSVGNKDNQDQTKISPAKAISEALAITIVDTHCVKSMSTNPRSS